MMVGSMSETNSAFLRERDRYFAPSVLAPFVDDVARRLMRLTMGPLLEVMCDTGVLTQAMASSLSAGLTIVATDPNRTAIDHAAAKPGMARINWQVAHPDALSFPDAAFGMVTCHFGVTGLANRVRVYREIRRAIKPNGRFVFSIPGAIRLNPVAACLDNVLQDLFPHDPPDFLTHVLHGYADNDAVDDDLTEAGYTDAIYTSVERPFAAQSARDAAAAYCLGTPLRSQLYARSPNGMESILQAATAALEARFGSGPVAAPMRAHVISAAG